MVGIELEQLWPRKLVRKARRMPAWVGDYVLPTGAALLFVLFWVESHAVNSGRHAQYVAALRELQALDARINQNLLQLQLGLLNSYDPIVNEQEKLEGLQSFLEEPPPFVGPSKIEIQAQVTQHRKLWDEKNDFINQFKSSHSILRNSLAYFPLAVEDILESGEEPRRSAEQKQQLSDLLTEILQFNLSASGESIPKLEQEIEQLRQASRQDADIAILLSHANLIVSERIAANELIEQALALPTRQQSNNLTELYDNAYQRAVRTANIYRLGLYLLLTALVLSVASATLSKLRRAAIAQQESENTQQALFQAIPDFMLRMSRGSSMYEVVSVGDGKLLSNPERRRADLFEVLPEPLANQRQQAVGQALATRQTQVYEQQIERQGELEWEEVRVVPCGKADVLVMVRDIGDRKQAEEKLQQATKEAQVANQAKSRFLSNMSHELRTPLNVILGFTQLMTRNKTLNPQQQGYLDSINQSGEHLLSLINDVLEMSKIEAGKVTLIPSDFNLMGLLEGIHAMFQFKANSKGVALHLEADNNLPTAIRADESKLRQILVNLIGNAVKFTRVGDIWMRVSVAELTADSLEDNRLEGDNLAGNSLASDSFAAANIFKAGDPVRLQFEVADTGPGLDPDEIESLFDPFIQAKQGLSGTQQQGTQQQGTGLGLPISRRFAELMGGKMAAESQVGQGSQFRFSIVAEVARTGSPEQAARIVTGLAAGQPSYRILLVEDMPKNRELMVDLLTPVGFELREAANGVEAVDIARQWQPHLIWMDLRMPVMDGYEATRQIRQASGNPEKPVIVALTGSVFKAEESIAIAAGCNGFTTKPFRTETIFETMSKFLGAKYTYSEPARSADDGQEHGQGQITERLTSEDLKQMPAEWLAQVNKAATKVNGQAVSELLAVVPEEQRAIAVYLGKLVENFGFEEIVNLTRPD